MGTAGFLYHQPYVSRDIESIEFPSGFFGLEAREGLVRTSTPNLMCSIHPIGFLGVESLHNKPEGEPLTLTVTGQVRNQKTWEA